MPWTPTGSGGATVRTRVRRPVARSSRSTCRPARSWTVAGRSRSSARGRPRGGGRRGCRPRDSSRPRGRAARCAHRASARSRPERRATRGPCPSIPPAPARRSAAGKSGGPPARVPERPRPGSPGARRVGAALASGPTGPRRGRRSRRRGTSRSRISPPKSPTAAASSPAPGPGPRRPPLLAAAGAWYGPISQVPAEPGWRLRHSGPKEDG
jgi:hypothetical protein